MPPAQPASQRNDQGDTILAPTSTAADALIARLAALPIERDRDQFLRELIRELSGTLEDIIGMDEAAGFISIVGARLGAIMNGEYRRGLGEEQLSIDAVAAALVDLKARIEGGFSIVSIDSEKIVLTNTACPFADYVKGRPSLCMMTSNVFGKIAAENLGFARVDIEEAIARGDQGCRVVIYLNPDNAPQGEHHRDYYETGDAI